MATYYVDDAGSDTSPYDTWAKAATSLSALDDAVSLASNDIVYIGHDHVCQYTHAANRTISLPGSGAPCVIISATQGSSPPTYQASSTAQVDTSEGAYEATFSGVVALYGVSVKSGEEIRFTGANSRENIIYDARLAPALNKGIFLVNTSNGGITVKGLVVDLSADGTTGGTVAPLQDSGAPGIFNLHGVSFVNAGYRTGTVISTSALSTWNISGADFSGFPSSCELFSGDVAARITAANCITASTWTIATATGSRATTQIDLYNVGPADDPTSIASITAAGSLISTSSIYRSGGAAVEGTTTAWLVVTTANASEKSPFVPPWIYGTISSTGSKTFTVYVTNDTADLTDAEAWLEVEYLGAADEANTTLASDRRTITTTAAAQTDDAASTWNGTGPSFTYKQSLAVTATVNEPGMFRARVCIGKASVASSAYLYIDPAVTVS